MVEIKKGYYRCTQSLMGINVGDLRRGQLPESFVSETLVAAQDLQSTCNNFVRGDGKKNTSCPDNCKVKQLIDSITASQSACENLKPTYPRS
jgi:hypothetical protein